MRTLTAVVLYMLVLITGTTTVGAQGLALNDHLKCYKVTPVKGKLAVSTHAADPLTLTPYQAPPFSIEQGCLLKAKPIMLCIPVDKSPRQSPSGTDIRNDFLVYKAKCPAETDFQHGVRDQFVTGEVVIRRKATVRIIMVPAYKTETPPPPCNPIAPHQCGGTCPAGLVCRMSPVDICGCFEDTTTTSSTTTTTTLPPPCALDAAGACNGDCPPGLICELTSPDKCACVAPCGGDPIGGVCNGFCPIPTDICKPGTNGLCVCIGQTADTCSTDPVTGQCGGGCADPAKQCVFMPGMNPPCSCQ